MASQNKITIEDILARKVTALPLCEILSSIDLDNYEKATTKYRKPCYQRGLKKPKEWGKRGVH